MGRLLAKMRLEAVALNSGFGRKPWECRPMLSSHASSSLKVGLFISVHNHPARNVG